MTQERSWLHIGFTGSREGISEAQRCTVAKIATKFSEFRVVFHHGDCIGADAMACKIASQMGWRLHSHPGKTERMRAFVPSEIVEVPMELLTRNKVIVRSVRLLIACPAGFEEVRRSGTWATVRYARAAGCSRALVWPDGKVRYEREI